MKLKVELAKGETIEQAETLILKAMTVKNECSGGERYADDYLNELEAYVCSEHRKVLDRIAEEVAQEISLHADR